MLDILLQLMLFFTKTVMVIIAVLLITVGIIAIISKSRRKGKDGITIIKLNESYELLAEEINHQTLSKKDFKAFLKQQKLADKKNDQVEKHHKRIFVLRFDGDIRAMEVNNLREEITAILTCATSQDEVLLILESAGGVVHGYGLAASQLQRLRDKNIYLTVAVDKVAASGGYMMACIANRILAAPFAIVGSIGVVFQLPNFNRFLKQHNVNFEQITAGEYKRTLTMFGENTEVGREKVTQEVEETHGLFKQLITQYRPQIDLQQVATGEHWFATQAIEFKLVDKLQTSDDFLMQASKENDLYEITFQKKKKLSEKILGGISYLYSNLMLRI